MLKAYKELYALDISEHISKKPTFRFDKTLQRHVETDKKLDYVSWADAIYLLHLHGADSVKYGNLYSQAGHSLFLSDGGLPEVHVYVDIDGDRRELCYPVIDGSTDVKMEKIAQSDIHNATQRAFVKCVAVNWGLGLKLWQKEEKDRPQKTTDDLSGHSIVAIKKRVEESITAKIKRGVSESDLCAGLGINSRQLKTLLETYDKLLNFEQALDKI